MHAHRRFCFHFRLNYSVASSLIIPFFFQLLAGVSEAGKKEDEDKLHPCLMNGMFALFPEFLSDDLCLDGLLERCHFMERAIISSAC